MLFARIFFIIFYRELYRCKKKKKWLYIIDYFTELLSSKRALHWGVEKKEKREKMCGGLSSLHNSPPVKFGGELRGISNVVGKILRHSAESE